MPRALRTAFEGDPRPRPFLNAETPGVPGTDTATLGRTRGLQPAPPVPPAAGHLLMPEGKAPQQPARAGSWQEKAWHSSSGKRSSQQEPGRHSSSSRPSALALRRPAEPRRSCGQSGQSFQPRSRNPLLPHIPRDSGGSAVWNSCRAGCGCTRLRLQGWHIPCQRPVATRDTKVKAPIAPATHPVKKVPGNSSTQLCGDEQGTGCSSL